MSDIFDYPSRDEWIKSHTKSTQMVLKASLKSLDLFYQESNITDEQQFLQQIRDVEMSKKCNFFKKFLIFLENAKKSFESQKAYVGWIRRWFVNNGVFIDDTLFKQQIRFKKPERERKFAFDLETLRSMIKVSNRDHRMFLLFLISTGARQGEVLQLTAGDIDWNSTPVMVNFRAGITKTKQERVSFLTPQCADELRFYIEGRYPHELIFPMKQSALIEHMSVMRKKLGLIDRYSTQTHKATLHRIRAFVKVQLSKAVSDDFAHVILGHSEGLETYDADNLDGMREDYTKAIPRLTLRI